MNLFNVSAKKTVLELNVNLNLGERGLQSWEAETLVWILLSWEAETLVWILLSWEAETLVWILLSWEAETLVDIVIPKLLISISNVDTFKFEYQCFITQLKLFVHDITIMRYRVTHKGWCFRDDCTEYFLIHLLQCSLYAKTGLFQNLIHQITDWNAETKKSSFRSTYSYECWVVFTVSSFLGIPVSLEWNK